MGKLITILAVLIFPLTQAWATQPEEISGVIIPVGNLIERSNEDTVGVNVFWDRMVPDMFRGAMLSGGTGTMLLELNQSMHRNTVTGDTGAHGEQLFYGTITTPLTGTSALGSVVMRVIGRNPGGDDPNEGTFTFKSATADGGLEGLHGHGVYTAPHGALKYTAWIHWEGN